MAASSSRSDIIAGPLGVKYDDHEHSISIQLVVPGIRPAPFVTRLFRLEGLRIFGQGNTAVDAKYEEESIRILIEIYDKGKKDVEGAKPRDTRLFEVKQLPGKILPDLCHFTLKPDKCLIVLHKATPGSWQSSLLQHGLDISG